MLRLRLCLSFVVGVATAGGGLAAHADSSIAWSGILEAIDVNQPGAIYGSAVAGVTPFSGYVAYPDACVGCIVEPFPPDATNYVFPEGIGGLMGAGALSTGIESSVEIIDEEIVDQDTVDVAALFGVPLVVGQSLDTWSAGSQTTGEFTPDFVEWDVAFVYATTDPFSDTSYTPTPPPNPDLIVFTISQDDEAIYLALGEVTMLPEPGFAGLLAAGALSIATRLRRARSSTRAAPEEKAA